MVGVNEEKPERRRSGFGRALDETLALQQIEELLIGQAGLPDDALDDVFWEIEALVVGNGETAGLIGVLELNV